MIDEHMIVLYIYMQIQNILLQLCGLAILVLGVLVQVGKQHYSKHLDEITENLMFPSITLIVIGGIIFVIAFLGCCGAIRENHCMIITVSLPASFISLCYNLRKVQLFQSWLVFTIFTSQYFNFNSENENSSSLYIPNTYLRLVELKQVAFIKSKVTEKWKFKSVIFIDFCLTFGLTLHEFIYTLLQ